MRKIYRLSRISLLIILPIEATLLLLVAYGKLVSSDVMYRDLFIITSLALLSLLFLIASVLLGLHSLKYQVLISASLIVVALTNIMAVVYEFRAYLRNDWPVAEVAVVMAEIIAAVFVALACLTVVLARPDVD